jgi:hypothetical protein
MATQIKKATLSTINYKEYPEFMFAMLSAFLPEEEGDDLRRVAGKVFFRSEDEDGYTYRNGLLHSYDDKPAISDFFKKTWFKDGKIHREGDLPACITQLDRNWYINGKLHREGDKPAVVSHDGFNKEWWKNGQLHREGDNPAIDGYRTIEWYKYGVCCRDQGDSIVELENARSPVFKTNINLIN